MTFLSFPTFCGHNSPLRRFEGKSQQKAHASMFAYCSLDNRIKLPTHGNHISTMLDRSKAVFFHCLDPDWGYCVFVVLCKAFKF